MLLTTPPLLLLQQPLHTAAANYINNYGVVIIYSHKGMMLKRENTTYRFLALGAKKIRRKEKSPPQLSAVFCSTAAKAKEMIGCTNPLEIHSRRLARFFVIFSADRGRKSSPFRLIHHRGRYRAEEVSSLLCNKISVQIEGDRAVCYSVSTS